MLTEVALCAAGLVGLALADPSATVNAPAAVTSINDNDGPSSSGTSTRQSFSGDGSVGAGWPAYSTWISFDDMFNNWNNNFLISCEQYGVSNDSQDEISDIRSGIEDIAQQSGVDHRFILAEIFQESSGCVRVPTTLAPDSNIYNPGLMQDHDGHNTCNCDSNDEYNQDCGLVNPCPSSVITGMIQDGAQGTSAGSGLATLMNAAQSGGASGTQLYYVASEWYNQGIYSPAVGGDLGTYAADIANYLVGWTGPS